MPTNKQRRDAARRHLERQIERRQEREIRRRKTNLILSIVGTLVVIAAIVLTFVFIGGSDSKKKSTASKGTSSTPAPSPSTTPLPQPAAPCSTTTGATATFDGVTVKNATNLKIAPVSTSKVTSSPSTLVCADLVVGKGAVATPTSTVAVQYVGTLLSNGTIFDSSWKNGGKPVSFPLTGVVPGFTQGIGGAGKVAPMHVGGRRIMILPAVLAYGASPPSGSGIPVNAPLVFVVDLTSVTAAASGS